MKLLLSLYTFATIILLSSTNLICDADISVYNQTQYLAIHNSIRAEVGVPPLVWNKTLADFAEKFANMVHEAGGHDYYPSGTPYGENRVSGTRASYIRQAVNSWASEIFDYDHATNSCKPGATCGNYTQVVWKKTTDLGCASVTFGLGWPFVICEYYPPGNIKGESPY